MGTDEFSRMRKEEDLEGDTLGCSIKEVVTKEIRFLLNPSFQLLWSACSLWPVADGKLFPLMKLIVEPGSLFYSALLSHVRLQNNYFPQILHLFVNLPQ